VNFGLGEDPDLGLSTHSRSKDYAVAIVDEVEQPRFIGKRFTVSY
jgi:putative NADH-flavin reductase